MLQTILDDAKVAVRGLARSPGLTAVVLLTLVVGIGANTAIFSVVDAVLLRPLSYPNAEQIVTIGLDRPDGETRQLGFSDTGFQFFREQNQSFEELGAYSTTQLALTGSGDPAQLSVGRLTNSAFAVLGLDALEGRLPNDEEDVAGGPLVVVLSDRLWITRFGGDPKVIGSVVQVDDKARRVVGIMPPDFDFPSSDVDLWIPLQLDPASQNATSLRHQAIGRLRDGATLESAATDVRRLIARLPEVGHPRDWLTTVFAGRTNVATLKERTVGPARRLLLIVFGSVSFVLLVACANVANLFLVRAERRARPNAVRTVLGATRSRLIQAALTESILVGLIGGIGGLALAVVGTRLLVALGPTGIPRLDNVGVSSSVLLYATAVSVLAGLTFGLLPVLRAGSPSGLRSALTDGGRGVTPGVDRLRLRAGLVVAQVAFAVVLLIGSGLMVRSLRQLSSVDPGFDPSGVVTFDLMLPFGRYSNTDAASFYGRLLDRVRSLSGVEAAGATTGLPVTPYGGSFRIQFEDLPAGPEGPAVFAVRWVTPGYFEAMRIPVAAGRTMGPSDDQKPFKAFVSSALGKELFRGASPIGKRLGPGGGIWGEVVGVMGDVHTRSLDAPPEQTIYVALGQEPAPTFSSMSVAVRWAGRPADLIPLLRREVGALDPSLPLIRVRTMSDVIADSEAMSRTRFTTLLLGLAALVAVFLGAVGTYGVISYVVTQRTSEIGLRMALGATSVNVLSLLVGKGMTPAIIGIAVGVGSAAFISRVLKSLLFQVGPLDPVTFFGGPVLFMAVAAIACMIPAWRAARIDPADALRSD